MKYFASTTRIFLFLILCTAADAGAAVLQGKVTEATEANVLTVQDGNRFYKIRLITITPPKGRHPLAEVARQHLADLTRDKFVTVKPVGLEQDGTVTGFVFYEGNDVGVQMVRDGAAWYDGSQGGRLNESARLVYEQSEQAARNEKRGVWQESLTARAAAAGSREKKIAAPRPSPRPHPAAARGAARAKTLSPAEKAGQLDAAAYYLIKRRQEGAALPLLMQAVQLDPANADVHKNLCIVFSVTPQLGEALARGFQGLPAGPPAQPAIREGASQPRLPAARHGPLQGSRERIPSGREVRV